MPLTGTFATARFGGHPRTAVRLLDGAGQVVVVRPVLDYLGDEVWLPVSGLADRARPPEPETGAEMAPEIVEARPGPSTGRRGQRRRVPVREPAD